MLTVISPVRFWRALAEIAPHAEIRDSRASLSSLDGERLVSFHSGAILPQEVLNSFRLAYNFHGGPPEFPGRDPHHWAIYDGATSFGVTVHEMTERVDEGPIVAVNRFDVEPGSTPERLRRQAEALSVWTFRQVLPQLRDGTLAPTGERWSGTKRTRADPSAIMRLNRLK